VNEAMSDVSPLAAAGRGAVLDAFSSDATGQFRFFAHTAEPLPFVLVERLVAAARRCLPP